MPFFEAGEAEIRVGGKKLGPFPYRHRPQVPPKEPWSVTLELEQTEQNRQDVLALMREMEEEIEQHCREQCGLPRTLRRAVYRHDTDANGAPA
jgi:hypothetical protein